MAKLTFFTFVAVRHIASSHAQDVCAFASHGEGEREKNEFFMSSKWIHLGGDGKCVLFFISQISIHNTFVRSGAFRRRRENRMRYMREDVSHLMMVNEAPNCRTTHKTFRRHTENLAQQTSNGAN